MYGKNTSVFSVTHTYNATNTGCVGFFSTPSNCVHQLSVLQFRCSLLGINIRSHKIRAQCHRTAPTSDTNCQSQIITCTSHPQAVNWCLYDPLFKSDDFLECLTEIREMAIYIYQFIIKNVIKDMNEEQEEEIH